MSWDPRQYLKFSGERLRPGFDLLAQVDELPPGPIYELGCGTGVHARAIAERWPERKIVALDNSRAMLAKAAAESSRVEWTEADIVGWRAPTPGAMIFSNATLHWIMEHDGFFPHLLRQLAPGGVLAVQMPRNHDFQTHALMRRVAAEGAWRERLAGAREASPVKAPEFYYDLLAPRSAEFTIWETNYIQIMDGVQAIIAWLRGTGLRPFLARLTEAERPVFLDRYAALLAEAYPAQADGKILLPYPRLFFIASKPGCR